MSIDIRPYPVYKDSGVLWLGQVPEHWQTRRIKHVAALDPSKSEVASVLSADDLVTFLPMQRVSSSGLVDSQESRRVSDVWNGFTYFRRSDVLVAKITPCFENGKGACLDSLPTEIGFGSTEFIVLRSSRAVLPRYLYRLTTVSAFRHLGADAMMGAAGQQRVPTAFVSNFEMPVPPLPEQAAIVRYLDHADRKVRHAIRARQRLITLLTEQKQAIIQRAVTRGLDPNVRLKPSGVPWLGDVPEHWEVRRIKSLSMVRRGASPRPIADQKYFDDQGEYAWVRIADVTASGGHLQHTTQRLSPLGKSLSVPLEPGSLFLSIAGSVGKPIITRIKCCIHDGFVYFPQYRGNAEFLCRIFECGSPFEGLGKFGTQLNLNTETVGNIRVGWPPAAEQDAIVQHLNTATANLDKAIDAARREIDLLREYRTRLIADVVTGKLDVRDAATHLPDELEEQSEPLDEELVDDVPDLESEEEGNGEQTES